MKQFVWLVEGQPKSGSLYDYAIALASEMFQRDVKVSRDVWHTSNAGGLSITTPSITRTDDGDDGPMLHVIAAGVQVSLTLARLV